MGVRDERVRDLFFETPTTPGEPTEEGQVRIYNNDIIAYINGGTHSLTTGSGLSEGSHEVLDTLTHWLSEDNYQEMVRSGGKVTNAIHWTDSGKTTKIREVVVTRSAGKVSQIDLIQYDSGGSEKHRLTGVITRTSGKVSSIQWTKTVS